MTFLPSFSNSLSSAASSSGSSVGVMLVMVTRPRLFQPASCGVTPIRSRNASSATSAPPSAGPSTSLPTRSLPVFSSRASSRYSSAISMGRTYWSGRSSGTGPGPVARLGMMGPMNAAPAITVDYPIVEQRLANGLRVIASPDHGAPSVAVNLWYDVGSRDEEPGRTGFAHLFEHIMFQGSAHVPSGQHIGLLQAAGAAVNATTWFDRTNYFETLPTGGLDLALWLEADRLGSLLDALTQESLDNQREVVKEERRQRYDNVPYGDAMELLNALTFPADHPYGHTTIGSMDDLNAATLADVQAFFRTHYRPSNAVLSARRRRDRGGRLRPGGALLRPAGRRGQAGQTGHRAAGTADGDGARRGVRRRTGRGGLPVLAAAAAGDAGVRRGRPRLQRARARTDLTAAQDPGSRAPSGRRRPAPAVWR